EGEPRTLASLRCCGYRSEDSFQAHGRRFDPGHPLSSSRASQYGSSAGTTHTRNARCSLGARKPGDDAGSLPGRALEDEGATVVLDELAHHAETESSPLRTPPAGLPEADPVARHDELEPARRRPEDQPDATGPGVAGRVDERFPGHLVEARSDRAGNR